MELIIAPIDKLVPYDANPRLITDEDIAKLISVIEANGFLDPIEVDASWTIVAGHRRLLAAKKLGLSRVPVIFHAGMTRDEAKAYRIAHNKVSEGVKWNRELLSNEVLALEHLISGPEDLGMDSAGMMQLFDLDRGVGEDPDAADKVEEPGPYILAGQRWQIGPVTFEVYDNLNADQMRKAEALIIKIQKLVKTPAMLGEVSLKEYLAAATGEGPGA